MTDKLCGRYDNGENQKKILQMLAEGKITVEEATRLLSLVNKEDSGRSQDTARELNRT